MFIFHIYFWLIFKEGQLSRAFTVSPSACCYLDCHAATAPFFVLMRFHPNVHTSVFPRKVFFSVAKTCPLCKTIISERRWQTRHRMSLITFDR